jgi:small-conductance mechanosensitive channel
MSPEEHVLGELIAIVAIVFSNILFGVLILAWFKIKHRRLELQAEVQTKLIDRFGSSTELVDFLKSSTGREFVHGVQKGALGVAHERVVAGIRKAIILSFLGIGLLAVWGITGAQWISWFGILFLALGLGFLTAAVVSMRMSRNGESAPDHASQL